MTEKFTRDRAAYVCTAYHWRDAKQYPPPLNTKMLCINRATGVAVAGEWRDTYEFTHWAPLPTFKD